LSAARTRRSQLSAARSGPPPLRRLDDDIAAPAPAPAPAAAASARLGHFSLPPGSSGRARDLELSAPAGGGPASCSGGGWAFRVLGEAGRGADSKAPRGWGLGEVNKEGKRRRWGVVSFLWLESRDFTAAAAWFFFFFLVEGGSRKRGR
jgi:hypothetical protein